MTKALTAFQVEKERGSWGALSEDQQKIVAMQSELKSLKDKNLKVDTTRKKKQERNKRNGPNKNKRGQERGGHKSYEWKDKEPKAGSPHTIKRDGKTYYWCPNHGEGKWVLHKLSECQNKTSIPSAPVANAAASTPDTSTQNTPVPGTTFAAAATAVAIHALNSDEE
jgi:hypothetical protein